MEVDSRFLFVSLFVSLVNFMFYSLIFKTALFWRGVYIIVIQCTSK